MKQKPAILLCLSLSVCLLAACGGKGASSSTAVSSAVSSAASSTAAPASVAVSKAQSSSTSPDSTAVQDSKVTQVSLAVTNEDRKAVLQITVPSDWTYDGYSNFSRGDIKVADIPALWKVTDPAAPFTSEMTDPFASSESVDGPAFPEGYGLQQTLDRKVGNNLTRTYLYKTIPDNGTEAWYPHFTFYAMGDYVLQIHFYTFNETADDAAFDAMLASAKLTLVD